MPITRGAAKDPKIQKTSAMALPKAAPPRTLRSIAPSTTATGTSMAIYSPKMALTWVRWLPMALTWYDGCDDGVDDPMAKMVTMQATIDLMRANQARRDDEIREHQEKMNKNLETLI